MPEVLDRPEPPPWLRPGGLGIAHAMKVTGSHAIPVWRPWLDRARREWCAANGCYFPPGLACDELCAGGARGG